MFFELGLFKIFVLELIMRELLRNIGLGLFVNGSYAIMNLSTDIAPYVITALSVYTMYITRKDK